MTILYIILRSLYIYTYIYLYIYIYLAVKTRVSLFKKSHIYHKPNALTGHVMIQSTSSTSIFGCLDCPSDGPFIDLVFISLTPLLPSPPPPLSKLSIDPDLECDAFPSFSMSNLYLVPPIVVTMKLTLEAAGASASDLAASIACRISGRTCFRSVTELLGLSSSLESWSLVLRFDS